jgi:hypothetical protein
MIFLILRYACTPDNVSREFESGSHVMILGDFEISAIIQKQSEAPVTRESHCASLQTLS